MSWLLFLIPSSADEWRTWSADELPRIGGVIAGVILFRLIAGPVIGRLLKGLIGTAGRLANDEPAAVQARIKTLSGTITWAVTLLAALIGFVLILDSVGLNVTPVVAGVSIFGIAVGLGAQALIKDVINGTFILAEDQYRVGDLVTVAGVTGEVVEINPRRTVIRDPDGAIHNVPNGTITTATNRSPSARMVSVGFEVPFREARRAIAVANEVGTAVAREHGADVLRVPAVGPIRLSGETAIRIEVVGETKAPSRWAIEGELRAALRKRLEAEHLAVEIVPEA